MEAEKIKAAAEILGLTSEQLIRALGLEEEEEEGPYGGFYFNSNVFRKLHSIDSEGLRKLVMPNLDKLRR